MAFRLPSRVKETTITQSTGDYALAGPVTNFRPFSVLSNGDTTWYYAESGGLWEFGLGTYSAGSLARTTIFGSSNGGTAVNWPAGTKTIAVGLPGLTDLDATNLGRFRTAIGLGNVLNVPQREQLTANRTYYVRTDGSDSNTGLADTAGGAFLTIQKAMDVIAALDISTFTVTVNVRSGTYAEQLALKTVMGSGTVAFVGDATTPANVVIAPAASHGIVTDTASGTNFTFNGFKIIGQSTDVSIRSPCKVSFSNIEWAGTAANYRIFASNGAVLTLSGAGHKVSGGGVALFRVESFGQISASTTTFTFLNNVTYSSAVCSVSLCGVFNGPVMTFTLGAFTVTGARYSATLNGVIFTGGGGANYFPGTIAGSTATGGQYA